MRGKGVRISGLLVAKGAKLLLCLNTMYVNTRTEYVSFKYERIADVADITGPGDFGYTTDDKSGYWQVTVHESMRTYLGMEWGGTTWVWALLLFGLAPACRLSTLMKQEVNWPLREKGVRTAFLIDDQAGVATGKEQAQFQCRLVMTILAALGFTMSLQE